MVGSAALRVWGSRERAAAKASARSPTVEMSVCEGICALQIAPNPAGLQLRAGALFSVPAPTPAAAADPLAGDRAQDSETVAEGPQVALAVDSSRLVAGDLDDLEAGGESADVHQRLDLKTIGVSLDDRS